jgi:TetR/AcrR family transcriptional regulator, copper-responsive repressor
LGINRPSLYAAFNDKKTLYQRALDLYAERMRAKFTAALDEDDLKKGLRALYKVALDAYRAKDGEVVGCMVACTAVTTALHDDDIRRQTRSIMDDIDALIARRIVRAVREGDLPKGTKVSTYSQLVVGVLHTLALRARAGASRRVLDELAENAVATLTARR